MIGINSTYKLKLADLYFDVTSFYDKYTLAMFNDYMVDSIPADSICYKVDCTITQSELIEPKGQKLTEREVYNYYLMPDGTYSQSVYDAENDCISAIINFDNNRKYAEVILCDVAKRFGIDDEFFLYNMLERLYRLAVVFNSGFVVHASSVVYDGYGLAFSAESGTGKSTHTQLWLDNYEGTYILNDDGPVIRKTDGDWYIYGSPWAGTTGINANKKVPLKALVFLERSKENTIRDCAPTEALQRIFEATIHPVSDEMTELILNSFSDFLTNSRVCILGCNISSEAAEVVKNHLF